MLRQTAMIHLFLGKRVSDVGQEIFHATMQTTKNGSTLDNNSVVSICS